MSVSEQSVPAPPVVANVASNVVSNVVSGAVPDAADIALRWDGRRVMFDLEHLGRKIPCAISRGALQQICGPRNFAASDMLRSFMKARRQIDRIALLKYTARPESICGIISIWADDIDDPPPSQNAPSNGGTAGAYKPR